MIEDYVFNFVAVYLKIRMINKKILNSIYLKLFIFINKTNNNQHVTIA